jgi:hypothetical protein
MIAAPRSIHDLTADLFFNAKTPSRKDAKKFITFASWRLCVLALNLQMIAAPRLIHDLTADLFFQRKDAKPQRCKEIHSLGGLATLRFCIRPNICLCLFHAGSAS